MVVVADSYRMFLNDMLDAEAMVRAPGSYRYLVQYRGLVMLSHKPIGVVLRRL